VNFGLGSKGSPPNQRLLLPGPAASTFGLVAEAGASDTPQQKRDPLDCIIPIVERSRLGLLPEVSVMSSELRRVLREVTSRDLSNVELEASLRPVLIRSIPAPTIDHETDLLIDWAFTLDSWCSLSDNAAVLRLARAYAAILQLPLPAATQATLGRLAESADRLLEIGRRFRLGLLTRTSWVAFVSERRLPAELRAAILHLSDPALDDLLAALESRDYDALHSMLDSLSG